MALNPKLNIYVVSLNPRDKKASLTFRDFFKAKYLFNKSVDDKELLDKFFEEFLNKVGKSEFRKDQKSKKVIGVSEYNPENKRSSINVMHQRHLIEGLIDGGQYGVLRAYADVDKKNEKTNLGTNNAVLDKFYICLCTPLNSACGFLFVQSYTEVTIQEPIAAFITDLLRCEDYYYNVRIEPYVPKKFVEKFKNSAKVKLFTYRSKIGISNIMRENQISPKGMSFNVEIKISPLEEELLPGSNEAFAVAKELAQKQFDGVDLHDYDDQKVYIEQGNGHKAHYDVKKELGTIRPTIYLTDEGIEIDSATGQPNFAQIKKFTLSLLEEVKEEYNGYEEIEEL